MISARDISKLKILAACAEFSTVEQIAKRVELSLNSVYVYISEIRDYVIKDASCKPFLFKRDPEKTYTPSEVIGNDVARKTDKTGLLLPQGPLSFLKECERYTLPEIPKENRIKEKHGKWVHRKSVPHIGCGSQAHVELLGH